MKEPKYNYTCTKCSAFYRGEKRFFSEILDDESLAYARKSFDDHQEYQHALKNERLLSEYEKKVYREPYILNKLFGETPKMYKEFFDFDHFLWEFYYHIWEKKYSSYRVEPKVEDFMTKILLCEACEKDKQERNTGTGSKLKIKTTDGK